MKAIEHRNLETKVKMSDSIILDAEQLAKNRTVYVRFTNTSEMQEIDLTDRIKRALSAKGYTVTNNPARAGYIIQGNVLYMDYAKDSSMTADAMAAGGFGGALLGSNIGSGWRANTAGALVVGAAGSVIGGLVGSMIHVDRFLGVVDVEIKERVEGGVIGKAKAKIRQGTSTIVETEREVVSDFQTYRTRIAVEAVQTNIDKQEAAQVITEKLVYQIAGIF